MAQLYVNGELTDVDPTLRRSIYHKLWAADKLRDTAPYEAHFAACLVSAKLATNKYTALEFKEWADYYGLETVT